MTHPILSVLALLLYLVAGALLWRGLLKGQVDNSRANPGILALGAGAVVLHAAVLYTHISPQGVFNLSLTTAASLIGGVIAVLFLIASLTKPISNLGIIVLPAAGLTVLLDWLIPAKDLLQPLGSPWVSFHVVISILAYSLLSLGALQGLLLLVQEHHLHHKHPGGFMRALPPMETMEGLMLQIVMIGFLLLTFTVISGVFFSEQVFGQAFRFTHHVVLSGLGWLVFGIFLLGRWRFGWRGRVAIRWVLGGVILLAMGYFGSRFVIEILLGR